MCAYVFTNNFMGESMSVNVFEMDLMFLLASSSRFLAESSQLDF